MASLEQLLRQREGCRNDVYLDSLLKPTVGIGHRVTPFDKLKVKDTIDDKQVSAFFKKDSAQAVAAARAQATKAEIKDADFITYLAAVNFQLGPRWLKEHKKTWALILDGKYQAAAVEVQKSKWYSKSPIRVKDFQGALRSLKDKPSNDDKK